MILDVDVCLGDDVLDLVDPRLYSPVFEDGRTRFRGVVCHVCSRDDGEW